jgi:hypothetical protein
MSNSENLLAVFAIINIIGNIANIAALIDYTSRVLSRIAHFCSKETTVPKAFRHLNNTIPLQKDMLRRVQNRIEAAEGDERTNKALHPLVTDCQTQLAKLDAIFEKLLPRPGDSWWKVRWKAFSSVRCERKVQAISVAVERYVGVLAMNFADAAVDTSMRINRAPDVPWDQKPIQLIDVVGRAFPVPQEVCQTPKVSKRSERKVPKHLLITYL